MPKVMIVGAGLCGSLLALRLADRGFEVEVYERRSDFRDSGLQGGRSINLALSNRGLQALRLVNMESAIKEICIPMQARMIHGIDGSIRKSNYSGRGDYINSVSRTDLNIKLLNAADERSNVTLNFDHKCEQVDLERGEAHFEFEGETIKRNATVIFGTDGAGSSMRQSMMRQTTKLLFNYEQHFLRHGYKELHIPPGENGTHRIEREALHIWPRETFMTIALPNLDGSFTVTLFWPFEGPNGFNFIDSEAKLNLLFEDQFSDLKQHLPSLSEDYFKNPTGTLGTIKCYPWQAYGKCLLMGDACHAIVPFYGQGMNASLEDVVVLDKLIDKHNSNWHVIFQEYQDQRKKDADAIAELALDNFHEMQDHVADPVFIEKRKLEMKLENTFPEYYSKYALVTFREEMSYSEAKSLGRAQDEFLLNLCRTSKVDELDLGEVMQQLKLLAKST